MFKQYGRHVTFVLHDQISFPWQTVKKCLV